MKLLEKIECNAARVFFLSVFALLLSGIIWGIIDRNFVVSFWGSALGTALGGMGAVVAAWLIWRRQKAQGERERSLRAGWQVLAHVTEICATARAGEEKPFALITSDGVEAIAPQRRAATYEAQSIENDQLRQGLVEVLRYLTTSVDEMKALNNVHPYLMRAVLVESAVRQLVEAFKRDAPAPSVRCEAFTAYDVAIERTKAQHRRRIDELLKTG
jgi:hypothetical protein